MTSYLTPIENISPSRTIFEIFDFSVFRVWPWPLTPKGHAGLKILIPFESPYMTSYLNSMDNISLSRTVLEIFDFEISRVWPWPSNPWGHLGSKNIMPFGSPYMTSYLTSMDTISLSRTVLEIFDFKVFRVWPWPLTPWGHLESNFFILFESPYDFLFVFYEQCFSIFYRFRDIQLQSFQGFTSTFDPWRSSGVKKFHTIRKPIYDFLFDFYGHHLSISYRFSIYSTSDFLRFDFDHWTLKVIWCQKIFYHSRAHIWLSIWLLLTTALYLVPFSRYLTSKYLWFVLDLRPLKFIWGVNFS